MAKRTRILVTCSNCKRDTPMDRALKAREPLPGVKELGIECVHCKHWAHQFYETPAMRAAQPVANTAEAKAAYAELFKAEQERIKEELAPQVCFTAG